MNVFSVTIATARMEHGREVKGSVEREFRFPSSADEITMRQWMDFQLRKAEAPDWFHDLERADAAGREEKMKAWDESTWAEFFYLVADLLATIVDAGAADLMRALPPIADGQNALLSLYIQLSSIIEGYTPKERSTFEWKSVQYVWPQKVVDSLGNAWYGQELTTAEAIEALQVEHVYNAKDENGVYLMNDRKYHVDVALLAVLTRKVLPDGTIEQVPLEYNARRRHLEKRIKDFADVPMSVCLDMAFFLTSSKIVSALTRISPTRSTRMSTT